MVVLAVQCRQKSDIFFRESRNVLVNAFNAQALKQSDFFLAGLFFGAIRGGPYPRSSNLMRISATDKG